MSNNECICLACGNHFMMSEAVQSAVGDDQCPKCSSSNVLKLNSSSMFGFLGGG
ncbi:MAG: hypothetical protein IT388_10350 [Nitrospirales bacterium]|nr:hypothetical protein [Nitrospirales bacterium]